jgi:hypothetical protein
MCAEEVFDGHRCSRSISVSITTPTMVPEAAPAIAVEQVLTSFI